MPFRHERNHWIMKNEGLPVQEAFFIAHSRWTKRFSFAVPDQVSLGGYGFPPLLYTKQELFCLMAGRT